MTKRTGVLALNAVLLAACVACIGLSITSDNWLALGGWVIAGLGVVDALISAYTIRPPKGDD